MAGYEGISCRQWLGLSSLSVPCRSTLGRKAAFSTLSILVALLIAGQAVTVYFVYQQSGQISKLTKTSQTLQLEALQRKLPASAKPVSKMKMAMVNTPLAMRVLPLAPSAGNMGMAPASNKTEDQVKHILLQADPMKMFPELKDNLMDNLKRLKSTMTDVDWKAFESWMHKWLLFEMAKNPKVEEHKAIPAEKDTAAATAEPEEMMFSGVDMLKLGAEKGERPSLVLGLGALGKALSAWRWWWWGTGPAPRARAAQKHCWGGGDGDAAKAAWASGGPGAILLTPSSSSSPSSPRIEEDTCGCLSPRQHPSSCGLIFFCSVSFLLLRRFPETINSGHPCALLPL
uniref:CD74 molecule n=1 Tax=Calidris pygmaea TaxID=425635 RepID=A0A8C3KHA5_9CHAR